MRWSGKFPLDVETFDGRTLHKVTARPVPLPLFVTAFGRMAVGSIDDVTINADEVILYGNIDIEGTRTWFVVPELHADGVDVTGDGHMVVDGEISSAMFTPKPSWPDQVPVAFGGA